ncbi:MAG: hypothetical protein KGM45_05535 [Actinomycetales bacterium]|nr:hypothetical protein [Actinomycetales bacterium]
MSNAFAALIWWVVPAVGLIGALGYVVWVTKFEGKFQQETQRSVGKFQRFQDSLRDSQARDVANGATVIAATAGGADVAKGTHVADDAGSADSASFDSGSFDSGSFDSGSSH